MRLLAHHRSWLLSLLFTALCVLVGPPAEAQVDPLWDHYKVYDIANPFAPEPPFAVLLQDQFGQYQHQAFRLVFFSNPVEKFVPDPTNPRDYPYRDSLTHYTWWELNPQPMDVNVRVDNQFGFQDLRVHDGLYLLNPALKNQISPPLPERNHYKCYLCEGQPVNVGVVLTDQFGTWQTTVVVPRFFCNPVVKQRPGQNPNPIITPRQHYTVYEFNPPDNRFFGALIRDQFHQGMFELNPSRFLMVPTDKVLVTQTEPSTWGRLKSLYR
jgi:hypothetical protein